MRNGITRRVTVEAGVRYDYQQIPPQFHQDTNNFSPRIRTNITQINPWFGTGAQTLPAFARPTEAARARQLQFSLDFKF